MTYQRLHLIRGRATVLQVVATANAKKVSFRTAAFINAFNKMQGTYNDSGFTI